MPVLRVRYQVSRGTGYRAMPPQLHPLHEFYLPLLPYNLFLLVSLAVAGERTSFDATDSFLLFHAALLALGNEPAFAADSAQHTALDDLLAKAFEQGVLRFAVT
jgi:hypothetical protein